MSKESFELILVPEEDKQQRVEQEKQMLQDIHEHKYSESDEFELLFVPIEVKKERVERERQVLQELRDKRRTLSSSSSDKEQEQKNRSFLWEWKELFRTVKSRMHRPFKRY